MTRSFFVRADPLPGESIYGYIYRLGEAQGHNSYKWIYKVFPGQLDKARNGTLLTAPDLNFLAESLRLSPHLLNEMRFPMQGSTGSKGSKSTEKRRFFCRGWLLDRQDFMDDTLYFCPLCIQEGTSHLLIWHLTFVVTCHHHRCRLVNSCPTCRRQYGQHAVKNGRCGNCSENITPTFVAYNYLHRTVKSLVSMIGGYTGSMERHGLPRILEDTDLSTALKLILFFARLLETKPRHGRNSVRATMEEDLWIGMSACERFDRSGQGLLERISERGEGTCSRFRSLTRLARKGAKKTRYLIDGAIGEFKERAQSDALRVPSGTDLDSDDTEFVRIDRAAECLMLTKTTIKNIAARQRGPTWRKRWMKSTYIHPSEIRWIQSCRDGCMSCKEAGEVLGISDRHQVQSLYDHFIFPHADTKLQLDHRSRGFHRDSVERLCRLVGDLNEHNLIPGSDMSWRTAKFTYMSLHHSSIEFYRAVIERRLIPIGRQPGIAGLPGLIFRRNDVFEIAGFKSFDSVNGGDKGAMVIPVPN